MYYIMVNLNRTREEAEAKFRNIFDREPDEVVQDHNYWWIGKASGPEYVGAKALGRLKGCQVIEARDAT